MEMKSMKLSKKAATEMSTPEKMDAPQYPWGLNLSLNDESMKKLAMKTLPEVGKKMMLMAVVEVVRVSENSTQDGKRQEMSIQITDMALESYAEKKDAASNLYGAS